MAARGLDEVQPGIPTPATKLPDSDDKHPARNVRVPDPRFATHLAAYFAYRVLASRVLEPAERLALILRLVPIAVADRTALYTVLSRLVLALTPTETKVLDEIDDALASYPLPVMPQVAGPEPVA